MKVLIPSITLIICGVIAFAYASTPPPEKNEDVQVVQREDKKRVDVFIDGELFTSYLFSEEGSSLKKPILYPLRTASGIDITRGYPFEQRAGERVDHPHHVGHWMNYGDVNGLDFWNHSESTQEERKSGMGTIVHRSVHKTEGGSNRGLLEVEMDWLKPDGTVILTERTQFIFKKADNKRMIDRVSTITAPNEDVAFTDNKEGMLAIRVTRALEHPSDSPVLLTDKMGAPLAEEMIDNKGVSGQYLSSQGVSGVDVWGTRAHWMLLSGIVQNENVSVAIIDHPGNPGYPTYWHARGYGLFAANPLGQNVFSKGDEELNFSLKKGESATFQYRIVILSNDMDPTHTVETLSRAFSEV